MTGRLKDDCFALPSGVDWTPVDVAFERLRAAVRPIVSTEVATVAAADGRVLAKAATAKRANPPSANAAVDGYGYAHDAVNPGRQLLPLIDGRAAAGSAQDLVVPAGHAVRILTGATLPAGVDTVVLHEDCEVAAGTVTFDASLKHGANCRQAGEDFASGEMVLKPGHALQPQDLALLAASGLGSVSVFRKLKVGVLSTGDEIVAAGDPASGSQIYDANRPLLLSILRRWNHTAVDLGHVADSRDAVRSALNGAAEEVDAVITSGGASAGDEDHVSALLRQEGLLHAWRIAVKPGRPLALAQWNGVPVFGLPGNPVATFVCALIFVRPALACLAGADWQVPSGYTLPAAFTKNKKSGRREYLRARVDAEGCVKVFASEGSGRITGLSWSDGLVELGDAAENIKAGDRVKYIPYAAFGLT